MRQLARYGLDDAAIANAAMPAFGIHPLQLTPQGLQPPNAWADFSKMALRDTVDLMT